jgi:hypothetical protein
VLSNIESLGLAAIASIASFGENIGSDFENGFNIVITGLTQFGDDIANAFTSAGNDIVGGFNDLNGYF